jgi:hypothetical protein
MVGVEGRRVEADVRKVGHVSRRPINSSMINVVESLSMSF